MALLDSISVFIASVDEGGFAAAGRKLNLSRSAVGKTIAKLEAGVGVRLFHRSTRSQKLTLEGELLYEQARATLAQLDAVTSSLDAGKRTAQGVLRVTAPSALGRLVARPLLDLAVQHRQLRLQMTFTDHALDLIDDGIDLAVRVGPLTDSATLATRRLASMRMTLCAAPSYCERRGVPREIADLSEHDAIVYRRGAFLVRWRLTDTAGRTTAIVPNERIKFDDLDVMCEAAVAGLGVAWLPEWLTMKYLASGELKALMPTVRSEAFPIQAVWPGTAPVPVRLRLAIDALAERLPDLLAGNEP
jgi:DNA-binding transcriptional LysR family regulator